MARRPPQGPAPTVRFQVHHARIGAPPRQAWWVFDPESDPVTCFSGTALQCATYSHARRERHDHDTAVLRAHAAEPQVRCSGRDDRAPDDPAPASCPLMLPAGGPAYCTTHAPRAERRSA